MGCRQPCTADQWLTDFGAFVKKAKAAYRVRHVRLRTISAQLRLGGLL